MKSSIYVDHNIYLRVLSDDKKQKQWLSDDKKQKQWLSDDKKQKTWFFYYEKKYWAAKPMFMS